MAWSYSSANLSTVLAKVRLEVGDTDTTDQLLTDEELQVWIDSRADNVLLAAADACDALARRFARDFDFETDGQSFKRGARSKVYADRAHDLRVRSSVAVGSVTVTTVDGYSQDVTNEDTTAATPPTFDVGRWDEVGG